MFLNVYTQPFYLTLLLDVYSPNQSTFLECLSCAGHFPTRESWETGTTQMLGNTFCCDHPPRPTPHSFEVNEAFVFHTKCEAQSRPFGAILVTPQRRGGFTNFCSVQQALSDRRHSQRSICSLSRQKGKGKGKGKGWEKRELSWPPRPSQLS